MKKLLLSLIGCAVTTGAFAQYEISSELYAPQVGEGQTLAFDSLYVETPSEMGGGNQSWEFELNNDGEFDFEYADPDTVALNEEFPDADVVIPTGFLNIFVDTDGDQLVFLGASSEFQIAEDGDTYQGSGEFSPEYVRFEYPATFGSNTSSESSATVSVFTEGATVDGVPGTIDSIRFTQNIFEYESDIDAWGDMTLNGDVYTNVMREVVSEVVETIVEGCISVLPGTPCAYQEFFAFTDSTKTFNYHSSDYKLPIVQIETDYDVNFVNSAAYDVDAEPRATAVSAVDASIAIFPTVASSNVELRAEGEATAMVINANGQVVANESFNGATSLNVASFANGTYLVVVRTESGAKHEKIVIAH